MSETVVERGFKKNTSWKMLSQTQRVGTPVPTRKSILFLGQDINVEYLTLEQVYKEIEATSRTASATLPVDTTTPVLDEGKGSLVHVQKQSMARPSWDVYDYIVAVGALLVFIGLLIPFITKDKELAFIFPVGAACIGAGALLARRNAASP